MIRLTFFFHEIVFGYIGPATMNLDPGISPAGSFSIRINAGWRSAA